MNVQKILSEEFGTLKVLADNHGEPWFFGREVCNILGIEDVAKAIRRLENYEKMTVNDPTDHRGHRGGAQRFIVINESGLYSLILSSHKPAAKEFKKWVTATVIPSIRKNGGYIEGTEDLPEEYRVYFEAEIRSLRKEVDNLQKAVCKEKAAKEKVENLLRQEDEIYLNLVNELESVYRDTEDYRKTLWEERIKKVLEKQAEKEKKETERRKAEESVKYSIVFDAFGNISSRKDFLERDRK